MLICGLKLTHDGSVALLDDDRLLFSVEMEKLGNRPRHGSIGNLDAVVRVLADFGYCVDDVDEWVIDGWDGLASGSVSVVDGEERQSLELAPYHEGGGTLFEQAWSGEFVIDSRRKPFTSYLHVAGHIAGAYMTSGFAQRGEASFCVVWDDGMFARLYYVDPRNRIIEAGGPLFALVGQFHATAAHYFGPYQEAMRAGRACEHSIAGALTADVALGKAHAPVVRLLAELYAVHFTADTPSVRDYLRTVGGWGASVEPSLKQVHRFFDAVARTLNGLKIADEDVLASVHEFLESLLVTEVARKVVEWKGEGVHNLCVAGSCALNIRWNSALRDHPLFREVWIPPFANDSGSALGVAATHAMQTREVAALNWHPRLGPALMPVAAIPRGWHSSPCSPAALAAILHNEGKPVVILDGRAGLGPHALGCRSVIGTAGSAAMKGLINKLKNRERSRPLACMCLADEAPAIFDPGTPDPYMMFAHVVREEWLRKIPAIAHIDSSARVQTVSAQDDATLHEILQEYFALSGVPVLCNAGAHNQACGCFADVGSAMKWGRAGLIWSDGVLYRRQLR